MGKQCRPHNVASDQGLQCLLTEFSIKRIKVASLKWQTDSSKMKQWKSPPVYNGLKSFFRIWAATRHNQQKGMCATLRLRSATSMPTVQTGLTGRKPRPIWVFFSAFATFGFRHSTEAQMLPTGIGSLAHLPLLVSDIPLKLKRYLQVLGL